MSLIKLLITAEDQVSSKLRSWGSQWKTQASQAATGVSQEIAKGIADGIYKYDKNGKLRDASGRFVGLGNQVGRDVAQGVERHLGEVSMGKLIGASAVGNLIAQGITSAIGLGLQQVQNFQRAVIDAASIQTSMLADASDLAKTLGVSMAQAKELNAETRQQIAEVAAALPGETRGYSEVFQAISATLGELNRGNPEAFQQDAMDTTKRLGFLASKAGSSGIEAGSAVNRFIQGTATFGELRLLDVFQKNPMFQKAIREAAGELGLDMEKGFKNASTELRFRVIEQALKTTVTDDLIAEFDHTAEGYIQTMRTKLLDPDIGLFGFLRKVPVPGGEGRSVIEAVTSFLGNFMRLGESLGRLLPGIDPLLPLIQFIDVLTGIAGSATLFLNSVESLSFPNLGELGETLTVAVSDWLSGVVAGLNPGIIGLTETLQNVDWSSIGVALVDATWFALGALGAVLASLDWVAVGNLLYSIARGMTEALAAALGAAFGKMFDGMLAWVERLTGDNLDGLRILGTAVARWIAAIAGFFRNVPVIGGMMGAASSALGAYADSQANATDPSSVGTGEPFSRPLTPSSPGSFQLPNLGDNLNPGTAQGLPDLRVPPMSSVSSAGTFAPQISVSGTNLSDPQGTADLVMQQLASQWSTYQSGMLSR